VHPIEGLDLVPVDEERTGLLPELVHVEEKADSDHRVAVVVPVTPGGAVRRRLERGRRSKVTEEGERWEKREKKGQLRAGQGKFTE
jgi:hypothetical protein